MFNIYFNLLISMIKCSYICNGGNVMSYSLGVDLGGTNIAFGIVDERYDLVKKSSVKTPAGEDGFYFADVIEKEIKNLCMCCSIKTNELKWVGIGAPGHVDSDTGEIIFACNIGISNFPMAKILEERLGCKTYVGNDANAAALGEALAGGAKGSKSSVTITLGTGIGMGIVENGKIITGCHYCAGEGGHMVIVAGGRQCKCGRKGCFETYASATGLITSTKEAMTNDRESLLWNLCNGTLENVTGKTAFDGKALGDKTAQNVVDEYIYYLASGITNIVNLLEPEVICIGGGISAQGDKLIIPLRKMVRKEQYSHLTDTTKIVRASLGNDAGLIGAALLGCQ